jgi:hypothetical protein
MPYSASWIPSDTEAGFNLTTTCLAGPPTASSEHDYEDWTASNRKTTSSFVHTTFGIRSYTPSIEDDNSEHSGAWTLRSEQLEEQCYKWQDPDELWKLWEHESRAAVWRSERLLGVEAGEDESTFDVKFYPLQHAILDESLPEREEYTPVCVSYDTAAAFFIDSGIVYRNNPRPQSEAQPVSKAPLVKESTYSGERTTFRVKRSETSKERPIIWWSVGDSTAIFARSQTQILKRAHQERPIQEAMKKKKKDPEAPTLEELYAAKARERELERENLNNDNGLASKVGSVVRKMLLKR